MYKDKYLKYCYKKRNIMFGVGKDDNIIIHICGASGSGKSTLGENIKDIFW